MKTLYITRPTNRTVEYIEKIIPYVNDIRYCIATDKYGIDFFKACAFIRGYSQAIKQATMNTNQLPTELIDVFGKLDADLQMIENEVKDNGK